MNIRNVHNKSLGLLLGGLTSLAAGLALPRPAHAVGVTITVNDTTDARDLSATDGECRTNAKPAAAKCTLRAAVEHANTLTATAIVISVPPGTYSLSVVDADGDRDLETTRGLTIQRQALSTGTVTIQLASGWNGRIFDHKTGSLYLRNVTIKSGRLAGATNDGGCILNGDTMTLDNVVVTDCRVDGARGGAIRNSGVMTLKNGTAISSSRTYLGGTAAGKGGGIYNMPGATLTVVDAASVNGCFSLDGGGIYNSFEAQVLATGLHLENNLASTRGGGVYSYGTTTLQASVLEGNYAASGGGVYQEDDGLSTAGGTLFIDNQATGNGGAVYLAGPTSTDASIADAQFEHNTATKGGAIYATRQTLHIANSAFTNQGATNAGGAIYSEYPLTVLGSSFASNHAYTTTPSSGTYQAGGAIYNTWSLYVWQSRFESNVAGTSGSANVRCGAVYAADLTLDSATFATNTSWGDGGALCIDGFGLIDNSTFASNDASAWAGGAVYSSTVSGAPLVIHSSTFKGNEGFPAASIYVAGGDVQLANSAFVESDLDGPIGCASTASSLVSEGYNFINTHTSTVAPCTNAGSTSLDLLGTNSTALLGSLTDNGGPTPTIAHAFGSALAEAGNPAGCVSAADPTVTLASDQRGAARYDLDGDGTARCDIGAYERYPLPTITMALSGSATLREGTTATLSFARSGSSTEMVSITCSGAGTGTSPATAGVDFAPATFTVTWAPSDASPKLMPIYALVDGVVESDETLTVTCTSSTTAPATLSGGPIALTIQNL